MPHKTNEQCSSCAATRWRNTSGRATCGSCPWDPSPAAPAARSFERKLRRCSRKVGAKQVSSVPSLFREPSAAAIGKAEGIQHVADTSRLVSGRRPVADQPSRNGCVDEPRNLPPSTMAGLPFWCHCPHTPQGRSGELLRFAPRLLVLRDPQPSSTGMSPDAGGSNVHHSREPILSYRSIDPRSRAEALLYV
jgi:hypothetical protein